jgi:hypothetical protein
MQKTSDRRGKAHANCQLGRKTVSPRQQVPMGRCPRLCCAPNRAHTLSGWAGRSEAAQVVVVGRWLLSVQVLSRTPRKNDLALGGSASNDWWKPASTNYLTAARWCSTDGPQVICFATFSGITCSLVASKPHRRAPPSGWWRARPISSEVAVPRLGPSPPAHRHLVHRLPGREDAYP